MTPFEKLIKMTANKALPLWGKNEHNEIVLINVGRANGERFVRVVTVQDNGWLRFNTYWESGTTEETYEK